MAKFEVELYETIIHTITVEAEDEETAQEIAMEWVQEIPEAELREMGVYYSDSVGNLRVENVWEVN